MQNNNLYSLGLRYSLILLLGLSVVSCFDDQDITEVMTSRPDPQEIVEATVHGKIIRSDGNPAPDVEVQILTETGFASQLTDERGYFLFVNKRIQKSAYITAGQDAISTVRQKIHIAEAQVNYTELVLPIIHEANQFSTRRDHWIEKQPWSIFISAESLESEDGTSYDGTVTPYLVESLPLTENFYSTMMGDLSGIDEMGNRVALQSLGMISIYLLSDSGTPLRLKEGNAARILLAASESLVKVGQESIPLWNLNLETGDWLSQENATQSLGLQGGFVGDITSLGTWNFDYKEDPINISGKISLKLNGLGSTNSSGHNQIFISSPEFGKRGGFASPNGAFNFYNFPKDEIFTMSVLDDCESVIFEKDFGPFSSDQILEEIEIAINRDQVVVSGTAQDCSDQKIKEGLLIIETENNGVFVNLFHNGEFSVAFDKECVAGEQLLISFMDRSTEETTMPFAVRLVKNNIDIGDIIICPQTETYLRFKLKDQIGHNQNYR